MQEIRYLDKLVDELAKGKPMRRSCASHEPARRRYDDRADGLGPEAAAFAAAKKKRSSVQLDVYSFSQRNE